jgi:hypothetical protein
MALSPKQIKNLKTGDILRMTTQNGQGDYHLDAKVVVISVGTAGSLVQITEILSKGEANMTCDGDRLVATFAELEILK